MTAFGRLAIGWLVLAAVVLGGCGVGASHPGRRVGTYLVKPNGERARINAESVELTPTEPRSLVRERLSGGAYMEIVSQRYRYRGRVYATLVEKIEEPGPHGMRRGGGGTGPSLNGTVGELLRVEVGQECIGSHEVVLVYGILRDGSDDVVATGRHAQVVLNKRRMPASLHAGGVLVYAALPMRPVEILTRTSSGRVVDKKSYTLRPISACK
jgi:hypothetical protein